MALGCNVTYVLTDYSRENGGLCFVPGSHRLMRQPTAAENFTGDGPGLVEPPGVVPVEASAGSLIVWHGNTWHGSYPRIAPGLRIAVVLYFCNSSLRPHEAYRELLAQEVLDREPGELARVLGRDVPLGWGPGGPKHAPGGAFTRHRTQVRPDADAAGNEKAAPGRADRLMGDRLMDRNGLIEGSSL
jgi:hypothetical protein